MEKSCDPKKDALKLRVIELYLLALIQYIAALLEQVFPLCGQITGI
jgi:hypothetical protein